MTPLCNRCRSFAVPSMAGMRNASAEDDPDIAFYQLTSHVHSHYFVAVYRFERRRLTEKYGSVTSDLRVGKVL